MMYQSRGILWHITISILTVIVAFSSGAVASVLEPPVNVTVQLGNNATFRCQIDGEHEYVRLNGILIDENPRSRPSDIYFHSTSRNMSPINVSITILNVSVERNNSKVECSDRETGQAKAASAYLTVIGGPAEPEVEYVIQEEEDEGKEGILLTWPPPFSWEDHPIIGYDVMCRNTETEMVVEKKRINETGDREIVQYIVELSVSDCLTVQCSVTAYNDLGSSPSSIINISIPLKLKENGLNLSVTLNQIRFTQNSKPEVELCVTLPMLCEFQTVRYTIVISVVAGDPVLQLSRDFFYSSGYTSQCIQVGGDGELGQLEEGTEYSVQVFLHDGHGHSRNYSSSILVFNPEIVGGVINKDEGLTLSETWRIVLVVVGALVLMSILILITVIIISCRRSRRQKQVTKAPVKRTTTPMVNNPIYERESNDGENPHYEQVQHSISRLNSFSSHTNLDSPNQRLVTPSNIAITSGSNHHLYHSRVPSSPTSNSSNNFSWPYSGVQHPNSATFDAIEADVQSRLTTTAAITPQILPSCTPGEESYMTMQSAVPAGKNNNVQPLQGLPRYAVDIHGNRYIEC